MSQVSMFQNQFIKASSSDRAQLRIRVSHVNSGNSQIGNLLQNIDVNDVSPKNRGKPSSIFFVCAMLKAFPEFKLY